MYLVMATRLSTGWMVGMVGTCTKFRYHSRPIHRTPLITCSQRMTKARPGMVDVRHLAGRKADHDDDDDKQDDAGDDLCAGDAKIAPMSSSPFILLGGLANPESKHL